MKSVLTLISIVITSLLCQAAETQEVVGISVSDPNNTLVFADQAINIKGHFRVLGVVPAGGQTMHGDIIIGYNFHGSVIDPHTGEVSILITFVPVVVKNTSVDAPAGIHNGNGVHVNFNCWQNAAPWEEFKDYEVKGAVVDDGDNKGSFGVWGTFSTWDALMMWILAAA